MDNTYEVKRISDDCFKYFVNDSEKGTETSFLRAILALENLKDKEAC